MAQIITGLKKTFVSVALCGVLLLAYFWLRVLPGMPSTRIYSTKDVSTKSGDASRSTVCRNGCSWRNLDANISMTQPLVESPRSKEPLPDRSQYGQCSYNVQLFDKNNLLVKPNWAVPEQVRKSRKGPHAQFDVSCGSTCNISLIIADETNKFAGMDAVVFHLLKRLYPNPRYHIEIKPNQVWVYFSRESPRANHREGEKLRNLPVHATMTYHRASDIIFPYGFYRPGVPMANQTKSIDEWMKGKTKLISWMASKCNKTSWPRYDFVKELKKYIPVDVYGACGNLTCKPNKSPTCLVDVMRKYKFYLSLENAECEDYITEKVWQKPLMQGVVPIVYGPRRKVYEDLLPPNSFIYIGDYKNVEELANYLKLLDSKPELYVKYLEWQYEGSVGVPKRVGEQYPPSMFCDLIPVIEKVRKGGWEPVPVGKRKFYNSCRKPEKPKDRPKPVFGLGKWYPW